MTTKNTYTMMNVVHEDTLESVNYLCPECFSGEVTPIGEMFQKTTSYSGTKWQCVACKEKFVSLDEASLNDKEIEEIKSKGPVLLEFSKEQVYAAIEEETGVDFSTK